MFRAHYCSLSLKCLDVDSLLHQVQVEVRKNWQHLRVARLGGLGSHRLVSTTMTYAAVPPNDGQHAQTASAHQHSQRNNTQQHYTEPASAAATRRLHLKPPNSTPHTDVIDDTVTSWFPDGCHGYGDVTEQQQQQHGGEALCMTPLNIDRH